MPAIRRTLTRNHVQQVPQRPPPANAPVAPQRNRNARAAPQEPEVVEAPPSFDDTLDRIDEKAEQLEDSAMVRFSFEKGTSISDRVLAACAWRGVDPEEPYLYVQKYTLDDGNTGLCCAVCSWANQANFQTFSESNDRVHKRHPLNDTHLQALGLFLQVDWTTLRNRLECPHCYHEVGGERHDQLTAHINSEHPEHKIPDKRKKRRDLRERLPNAPPTAPAPAAATATLSPLRALSIPAPFAGVPTAPLPAPNILPPPPRPQRSVSTIPFVPPRVGQQVAASNAMVPQLAPVAQRSNLQRTGSLPMTGIQPPPAATALQPVYLMAFDAAGQCRLLPWPSQPFYPVLPQQLQPIRPAPPQQLQPVLPAPPQQLQPILPVPRLPPDSLNRMATVPRNQVTSAPASGPTDIDRMLAEWAAMPDHASQPSSSTANDQNHSREGPSLTTMNQLRDSLPSPFDSASRPMVSFPTSYVRTPLSRAPSVSRSATPATRPA